MSITRRIIGAGIAGTGLALAVHNPHHELRLPPKITTSIVDIPNGQIIQTHSELYPREDFNVGLVAELGMVGIGLCIFAENDGMISRISGKAGGMALGLSAAAEVLPNVHL